MHQRAERRAHREARPSAKDVGRLVADGSSEARAREPRGSRPAARQLLVVLADHLGLAGDRVRDHLGAHRAERGVRRTPPGRVDRAGEGAHAERGHLGRRDSDPRLGERRGLGRRAAAVAPPANSATASSSDGTGGASGTSAESAARISIRCSGEATAFLVGDHQQTTCDWARVRATYSSRSHSPASSSWRTADVVGPAGAAAADVAAAPPGVVVEARQVGLGDVPVGDGGQVDDGVLQALAGVDRHQLHRGGVAVEPAGALEAAAGPALGDLLAQPGQQRDQAVPLGRGRPRAAPRRCGAGRSAAARRRPRPAPARAGRRRSPPRARRPGRGCRTARATTAACRRPRRSGRRRARRGRRRCARRSRSARPTGPGCCGAVARAPPAASATRSRAGVAKTLPPPAITPGTPTSASAAWASARSAWR